MQKQRQRRIRSWIARYLAVASIALSLIMQLARFVPVFDLATAVAPPVTIVAIVACLVTLATTSNLNALMFFLAAVLAGERVVPELIARARTAPASAQSNLVVLSFNVWRENAKPLEAVRAIEESGADVVLLQEAGPLLLTQRARLARTYQVISECPEGHCDTAVLSRFPADRPRYRLRDANGEPYGPGLTTTTVNVPGKGPVRFVSLHLQRPTRVADLGAAQRNDLVAALGRLGGQSLVVGGDFNLVPWSFALRDLDRSLSPLQRRSLALFSYRPRTEGMILPPVLPIDHMYATTDWRTVEAEVIEGSGSDHLAIRVRLVSIPAL